MIPIGSVYLANLNNNPVIFLMDIIFLVSIASLISWYFYYYLQKDIFGKFLGGAIIAAAGSVLFVIIQTPIRQIIMWFVSPKLGTMQLSRVNIIAAILGAYLSLYIFNRINRNRTRKD